MNSPILENAQIEWRNGLPFSQNFDDIYFSREDGLEETLYTFIEGNNLLKRWEQESTKFVIAETGFGTGLNFLSTLFHWNHCASNKRQLIYYSIEKFPLTLADLKQACECWPELKEFSVNLIEHYPIPVQGIYTITWPLLNATLILLQMDVIEALNHLQNNQVKVDAWYLDGFAPSKNEVMWQKKVFEPIAHCSSNKTTFATFTAAGLVRRGLTDVGFQVSKRKGFGTKREMLIGRLIKEHQPKTSRMPWLNCSLTAQDQAMRTVAIIGAGIAGCTTARALAESGLSVVIYEAENAIANGASGNSAGIFYPYLTADIDENSQFFIQAYHRLLHDLKHWVSTEVYNQTGMSLRDSTKKSIQKKAAISIKSEETCRWITPKPGSTNHQNAEPTISEIYFPYSGYVRPQALCKELISHPNIEVKMKSKVETISFTNPASITVNHESFSYDAVVICNSFDAKKLFQQLYFPTMKVRGQTIVIEFAEEQLFLDKVICDDIYFIPLDKKQALVGATFDRDDTNPEPTDQSTLEIIEKLNLSLPELGTFKVIEQKVGFRYCSIDRMPMIGPCYDIHQIQHDYKDLIKGKRLYQMPIANVDTPVYLNIGHGARGITSSFLSAQIINAMIVGHSLPLIDKLFERVSPLRFVLRNLKQ